MHTMIGFKVEMDILHGASSVAMEVRVCSCVTILYVTEFNTVCATKYAVTRKGNGSVIFVQ